MEIAEKLTVTDKVKSKVEAALGVSTKDARLSLTFLSVAFIALLIGGFLGLFQGLNRAGLMELPVWFDYYQTLTAHGVLFVLVFSTTFVVGYFYAGLSHTFSGLLPVVRKLGWTAFSSMVVGVVLVAATIISGDASVMFTFYPPMQASPYFYIGLVFLVLGIWIAAAGVFTQVASWKKNNPGKHIPIYSYFATGVFVMLTFSSILVAIEVFTLIPWAFGWKETVNVLVARTLFWGFGHTLVNIWYLSAVSAWYLTIPKILKVKPFSDSLTRLVVFLLVILNIPGGFHHQIIDPGITEGWKFVHVFMSLSIGFPSMMTAFAMFYLLVRAGYERGGKGLLGWFTKLPWKDVRFLALFIAMVAFIPGGAGGIAQTNNQLNQVVHNSLWVVGHFHLTLGVSAALTFFGISYWLIPYLSKRTLTPAINKLGLVQTACWTIGMLFMSGSMHAVGLLGSPRRTSYSTYNDHATALSWDPYLILLAVGGTFLIIGVVLMVYIAFHLMFRAPKGQIEVPIAVTDTSTTPMWLERWGLCIVLLIFIVAMGYAFPLMEMINTPGSPPFRTW